MNGTIEIRERKDGQFELVSTDTNTIASGMKLRGRSLELVRRYAQAAHELTGATIIDRTVNA